MAIAFFDLDRTLLAANSGVLWVRRELKLGHISHWIAARASLWLVRYQLGSSSIEDAILAAIASLEGSRSADLAARTDLFYDDQVRYLFRPGALAALEQHRRQGDLCVLLTSSSHYLAERVARELGFDGALCNRLEIDAAGLHTGKPAGALCFGKGKLVHAQNFAADRGIDLSQCTFYTDSFTDLPVLEKVGHPVAVNPDNRLRRTARRRHWQIVDWGTPGLASEQAAAL